MNIPATMANTTLVGDTPYYVSYDFKKLDHLDSWMYVVISFVGIITSLFLFLGHIFSPALRKPPGDLVMMVSLAEFLLSCHWFTSGVRTMFFTSYDKDPGDPKPPTDNFTGIKLTPEGYKMDSIENGRFDDEIIPLGTPKFV